MPFRSLVFRLWAMARWFVSPRNAHAAIVANPERFVKVRWDGVDTKEGHV